MIPCQFFNSGVFQEWTFLPLCQCKCPGILFQCRYQPSLCRACIAALFDRHCVLCLPTIPINPQGIDKNQGVLYILITPFWPRQIRFQILISLSKGRYMHLPLLLAYCTGVLCSSMRWAGSSWQLSCWTVPVWFLWPANVLLNACRPSTRRSYTSKWVCFTSPTALVSEYLLSLKESSLLVSSLKVHVANISAFHTKFQNRTLFSHPASKNF